MANMLSKIIIENLHGRNSKIELEFKEGVNIIHGPNGAGKTTILHIISNALNGDFGRFSYLKFDTIKLVFGKNKHITITKSENNKRPKIEYQIKGRLNSNGEKKNDTIDVNDFINKEERIFESIQERRGYFPSTDLMEIFKRGNSIIPYAYYPAFRTMIEAWSYKDIYTRGATRHADKTIQARLLFGQFTPILNFPSIIDIYEQFTRDLEKAIFQVGKKDSELLYQAIINIAEVLTNRNQNNNTDIKVIIKDILDKIDTLENSTYTKNIYRNIDIYRKLKACFKNFNAENGYSEMGSVLTIYQELLKSRLSEQENAFADIKRYLDTVNSFFVDKSLDITSSTVNFDENYGRIRVVYANGTKSSLKELSSGERQIITLLYASTKLDSSQIILIDEPEISLHLDWQETLMRKMTQQLKNNQIIVCTHSPVIASGYVDRMISLDFN